MTDLERMLDGLRAVQPLELKALTLYREQSRESGRWMPALDAPTMLAAIEELSEYRHACHAVTNSVAQLPPMALAVPCPEFGL